MFNDMAGCVQARMRALEAQDAADRENDTPRAARLRQITPDTGRLIALLAATAPGGAMIEVGTSAGYSTLWLALACRETGRRITTYEVLPEKARLARETFRLAQVEDVVELVEGDALDHLEGDDRIGFCFLDADKEIYADCYRIIVPRLVPGGLLVADNATTHAEELGEVVEAALADSRLDTMVLPVGKGELLCRKR